MANNPSSKLQYQIMGDDMQIVRVTLAAGEQVRAEAGSMLYMTQDIKMETQFNTSGKGGFMDGLMSGLKRVASGDSLFMTTFTAQSQSGEVAFAAPYPGKIVALDLKETGPMLCQRDSFLCSDPQVDISIAFTKRIGAGFFGGEGFILQELIGTGTGLIHAGGMIIPLELQTGQSIRVDTGCLVAMTSSVLYDIQLAGGVKTALFGGEGLFLANLTGPGKVYLQSLPFSRIADRVLSAASTGTEESRGVAGIGGKLIGDFLSGGS